MCNMGLGLLFCNVLSLRMAFITEGMTVAL